MRYRIECLTKVAEERTICYSRLAASDILSKAVTDARGGSDRARAYGAEGFQIRDMRDDWSIAATHAFND